MSLAAAGPLAASGAAAFAGERSLVFIFAAVLGVSSTLFRPALQALLPSLARTPEELIAANGASSTVESIGTFVGPLIAGLLVSVASVGVVFFAVAGVLLAAAALLARVAVPGRVQLAGEAGGENVSDAIGAGIRWLRARRGLACSSDSPLRRHSCAGA
jgi:MFS family permease